MLTKQWKFGTVIPCEVLELKSHPRFDVLLCKSDDYPGEGFICVLSPGSIKAAAGDRGTLTAVAGGPTGQHLVYTPQP